MTWERMRIEHLARPLNDMIDPGRLGEQLVEHYSIPAFDELGGPTVVPASEIDSNKQPISGGEVLVSKLNPRKARVFVAPEEDGLPKLASGEFIVLRPTDLCEPRFLLYLLLAESTRQLLDASVNSVTRSHQRVRPEVLTKLWVRTPSPREQRAIADYLDAETARIDALIAKKQQLIHLLEERFYAEARAFITGQDHEGSRWCPGPHWLGTVPSSWAPKKVAWHKSTGSGTTPAGDRGLYYSDNGMPWVTTSELREKTITSTSTGVTTEAMKDYSALSVFPVGTILIAMYGATVGRLGVLGIEAATNQACCAIFGGRGLRQDYLYWWLLINREHLIDMAYGAGQPNISQGIVRSLRVPAPADGEQEMIASSILLLHKQWSSVAEKQATQLELLAERRQALITAAVTDEFKVPGAP